MITDALPQTLDETFSALADLAHRRVSTLPPKLVAAHVVSVTAGADWSVRAAALEAIVRRLRFAERDELVIKTRPRHRVLGGYTTGRKGERVARPYESWVGSIAPLRARCSCADFLRSSLGVCKHVLAVLTDLFVHERRVRAALREGDTGGDGFAVTWSPEIALEGPLDRLVSLRRALTPGKAPAGWVPARAEATNAADVLWARALPGATQRPQTPRLAPDRTALHDPERRLAFLRALTRNAGALDPAVRALAAEELARTEARTAAAGVAPLALAHLRSLRRKLYPYQEEGVRRFLEAGRLLLADDMGLGKTTQAIAACHALYRARKVKRGVLIVPAALKSQWLREWEETTDVPAASVDGSPAERAATYRALERGFLLIGYEQLLKDFAHVAELAPDLVVLDEAQRIKNFATKSATYVKALTPRWRLVLTGTPMENRLGELASLLDWIDDLALAPKWRLDPWYLTQARAGDAASGGARHLDTLRTRLAPCTIRRRREEVLRDLPTRTDTRVPVSMTEQQRLEHDDLNQPIAQLVAIAKKRPLRPPEFLRLMTLLASQRMISNGLGQVRFEEMWPAYSGARPDAALIEGLFAPKLVELRRLVEELVLGQKRKVVIFSQWRRMLRLAEWSLRDILGDAGVRAVFFTGAESQKQRTRSIVDFHDEPDVRVMLLSDAGGVGLNLQRAASACINLELPWNPAVLEQRIGRIYRIGQKRPIDVYNLINEYGIESRIAHLVATKQAIFRGLFDGDSDEVRFEGRGSFFADVERLVAEAPIASDPPAAAAEDAEDDTAFADTPDVALPRAPAAQPADLAALFATLRVRTTADGSVSIEAPREAAVALTAVFAGMAQIMAAAARGE